MELDGVNYKLQSVTDIAYDCVNYINSYCNDNNIVNSKGEQIYVDINPANPLYIIIFGICYIIAIVQKLIYSVGCAFSIANASESQLLNLAHLMRIKRNPATYTTLNIYIYAELAQGCTITTADTITVSASNTTVIFTPMFELNIPAGGTGLLTLQANQLGAFNIGAGTITAFDNEIAGLRRIEQLASIPGTDQEGIDELRLRMNQDTSQHSLLDKCQEALMQLEGISDASLYYNAASTTVYINGIPVDPRTILLTVQGYSPYVAETYFKYLILPTQATVGSSLPQTYTTQSGQEIIVHYHIPTSLPVYIKVYTGTTISDSVKQDVKDTILQLSSRLKLGDSLSTAEILKLCIDTYADIKFTGAQISIDNESFSYTTGDVSANSIISLNSNNIEIS